MSYLDKNLETEKISGENMGLGRLKVSTQMPELKCLNSAFFRYTIV
jgi:hypothetical protein